MFNPSFFDQFSRLQRYLGDFLVYTLIYVFVYTIDIYLISELDIKLPTISLLAFIILYLLAREVIKKLGKAAFFGSFVNEGWKYCVFMAVFSWWVYTFIIRWKKF